MLKSRVRKFLINIKKPFFCGFREDDPAHPAAGHPQRNSQKKDLLIKIFEAPGIFSSGKKFLWQELCGSNITNRVPDSRIPRLPACLFLLPDCPFSVCLSARASFSRTSNSSKVSKCSKFLCFVGQETRHIETI